MPGVYEFSCSTCDFTTMGSDPHLYVVDANGERIICIHPGEEGTIAEVLGEDASPELIRQRVGWFTTYMCFECAMQLHIDNKQDPVICGKCGSTQVVEMEKWEGQLCPKCKAGRIGRGRMVLIS
jgi:hypothetical protein